MWKKKGCKVKKVDKKHKIALQDVFLYSRITRNFITTDFEAEISTPFRYKDGDELEIWVDNDVLVGTAERNFQRDRLYANRGKLIMVGKRRDQMSHKIVGHWSEVKKVATLFPTERLLPEELELLGIIQKHLTENGVSVKIELDEKKRFRLESRRRRGDRVRGRGYNGRTHREDEYDDEEDY